MGVTVYDVITDRIVSMLEKGVCPWKKPWGSAAGAGEPKNLVSGNAYRGVNVFLLSSMGFSSPFWVTYRQAAQLGGHVRKAERSCPVVFWRWNDRDDEEKEGQSEQRRRAPVLRFYSVWNTDQCEGLKVPEAPPVSSFQPIEACERIVRGMPNAPRIEHGGQQAFYRPSTDTIVMPPPELFDSPELYYSVRFHEIGHASGAASRLARPGITDATMRDRHLYGKEELVAEMISAYLCGIAGIETATLQDSAAYLASWIKVLKGDSRMAVTAGALAQKGVDHILGRSRPGEQLEAA